MGNLLAIVAAFLVFCALTALVVTRLVLGSLRKRLRVHPKVRSDAPLLWLWLPSPGAQLHRRLQNSTAIVRATTVRSGLQGWVGSEFPALIAEIETEAVRLSRELTIAARQPGTGRKSAYGRIETRIATLEATVDRLVETASDWSSCTAVSPAPLARIDERLDALRAAARDVAEADRPMNAASDGAPVDGPERAPQRPRLQGRPHADIAPGHLAPGLRDRSETAGEALRRPPRGARPQ